MNSSLFDDEKLGRSAYEQVKQNLLRDPILQQQAERLVEKALNVLGRKFQNYTIGVVNDRSINAFALPGGYIFLNLGMVQEAAYANSESLIAGVLAHEIEHTNERHGIDQVKVGLPVMLGAGIFGAITQNSTSAKMRWLGIGVNVAGAGGLAWHSRHDEWASDKAAHRVLKANGYSLEEFARFWDRMDKMGPRVNAIDGVVGSLFADHPSSKKRAKKAREAGKDQQSLTGNSPEWETFRAHVLNTYGAPQR